jgi:hypothetical protein
MSASPLIAAHFCAGAVNDAIGPFAKREVIVNRDEESVLSSPERQKLISEAVAQSQQMTRWAVTRHIRPICRALDDY